MDANDNLQIPSGTIVGWFPGASIMANDAILSSNVPNGWVLCDGHNGTPNLTARFVFGTSQKHEIGQSGGRDSHSHNGRTNQPDGVRNGADSDDAFEAMGVDHNHAFSTDGQNHLPPFVRLAFIMKI